MWYGSREIAASRLTSGEFASFIAALFMMYGPVKKLSRVTAGLQQAAAAAERIFETLDVHTEVLDRPNAATAAPLRHSIAFRDVGFSYQGAGGQLVLKHLEGNRGRSGPRRRLFWASENSSLETILCTVGARRFVPRSVSGMVFPWTSYWVPP